MQEFSFDQAYLFNTGTDIMSYNFLGSHEMTLGDIDGFSFAVWAPTAKSVSVVGDFNSWNSEDNPMQKMGDTGIFYVFIPGVSKWQRYKYCILSKNDECFLKSDPYAIHSETRQGTASIMYPHNDGFVWNDFEFISKRMSDYEVSNHNNRPLNIYEVHLGSWKRYEDGGFFNYQKVAHELASYVKEMGYTHIELLPVMEHPLDDSWGYQVTGFFSPTSRFGTPYDFKYFVDYMHQQNIGVILDWVPGHFPKDAFALARFDGTAVYEYFDDRVGEHKEWGTYVFDYSKSEVRSFLVSNAIYWIKEYHIDGIRVDAVSSMLYLNYGRTNFLRNIHGGIENLEAISFLQYLNKTIHEQSPDVMMIAEESTSWPKVTEKIENGGLGFSHKWNMGWMHDTTKYFSRDYIYRKWHQSQISFSLVYAFSENFILPLSHDEVVHGKGSMINKMQGDNWRKFASLRTLYAYMMAHPGGKLLFMGSEFGQFIEWRFYEQLEWFMLKHEMHYKLHEFVKCLNHTYLLENALWEQNQSWDGFAWNSADDSDNNMFVFSRFANDGKAIVVVLNMSVNPHMEYAIGVRNQGTYSVLLDSDSAAFGGSGYMANTYKTTRASNNFDKSLLSISNSDNDKDNDKEHDKNLSYKNFTYITKTENFMGFPYKLNIIVPPLSAIYLKILDE